jgi:hypothetical protein
MIRRDETSAEEWSGNKHIRLACRVFLLYELGLFVHLDSKHESTKKWSPDFGDDHWCFVGVYQTSIAGTTDEVICSCIHLFSLTLSLLCLGVGHGSGDG